MRIGYSDEEDFPGQFHLWQANCDRSLHSKRGQAALRRLEAALLAMPEKRLISEKLAEIDEHRGRVDVCAIGALAMMEEREDVLWSQDDTSHAGERLGMPRLVAWKVVEQNDIENDGYSWVTCPGPNPLGYRAYGDFYMAGYRLQIEQTPEDRYTAVLAWVRSQLRGVRQE